MTRSVPDRYFFWLYDQVCTIRSAESMSSYVRVCRQMHDIPFKALVPNDSNRIADGGELRKEFMALNDLVALESVDVLYPDITIFEVLVALTKRAEFMASRGEKIWFTQFLKNLGLERCYDYYMLNRSEGPIVRTLNKFNERRYRANGDGGIFPLKIPDRDQRDVELWYQLGAYITENHLV